MRFSSILWRFPSDGLDGSFNVHLLSSWSSYLPIWGIKVFRDWESGPVPILDICRRVRCDQKTRQAFPPRGFSAIPNFKKTCSDHVGRDFAIARIQSPHPFSTITSVTNATLIVLAKCIALQMKVPPQQRQMLRLLFSATALLSS